MKKLITLIAVVGLMGSAVANEAKKTETKTETVKVAVNHVKHENHEHKHGAKCGHKATTHGNHTDYEHDGHKHKVDGDHTDECQE